MADSRIHFAGKELVVAMPPDAAANALWGTGTKPVPLETADGQVLVNPDAVLFIDSPSGTTHGRAAW